MDDEDARSTLSVASAERLTREHRQSAEALAALQDAVTASYALVASRGYANIALPVEIWQACREASERRKRGSTCQES